MICYWKYEDDTSQRTNSELILFFMILAAFFKDYLHITVTLIPVNIYEAQWRKELQKEMRSLSSASCGLIKQNHLICIDHLLYKQGFVIPRALNLTEGKSCVSIFGFAAFEYQKYAENRIHWI
jgi:hypothetical protein